MAVPTLPTSPRPLFEAPSFVDQIRQAARSECGKSAMSQRGDSGSHRLSCAMGQVCYAARVARRKRHGLRLDR